MQVIVKLKGIPKFIHQACLNNVKADPIQILRSDLVHIFCSQSEFLKITK